MLVLEFGELPEFDVFQEVFQQLGEDRFVFGEDVLTCTELYSELTSLIISYFQNGNDEELDLVSDILKILHIQWV